MLDMSFGSSSCSLDRLNGVRCGTLNIVLGFGCLVVNSACSITDGTLGIVIMAGSSVSSRSIIKPSCCYYWLPKRSFLASDPAFSTLSIALSNPPRISFVTFLKACTKGSVTSVTAFLTLFVTLLRSASALS